jgi:hypothetical protein
MHARSPDEIFIETVSRTAGPPNASDTSFKESK